MAENKQIMILELGIFRKNLGLHGSGKQHNITDNRLIMFNIKHKSNFVNCQAFFYDNGVILFYRHAEAEADLNLT